MGKSRPVKVLFVLTFSGCVRLSRCVLIFVFSSAHVSLMQDSLLQLALHKTSHQHEANSINPIIRIKFLYLEKINQLVCIRFHFLFEYV